MTLTREQIDAIDMAAALKVCEEHGFDPSNAPYIKRIDQYVTAVVNLAFSAGRDAGLAEAEAACDLRAKGHLTNPIGPNKAASREATMCGLGIAALKGKQ